MKRLGGWSVAIAGLLATGCIESKTVVTVGADGAGAVVVEEFMSPQMTAMMEQFKGAMGGDTNAAAAADPLAMFAEPIAKKAEELGGKVTLTAKEAATNAAGWKGYRLTYAFDNIAEVALPLGAGGGEEEEKKQKDRLRVEFKPGPRAVLRLIPPAKPPRAPALDAAAGGDDAPANAQMAAMMAPMLAGMRIGLELRVKGSITRIEGAQATPDRKGVVLLDIPMDKLMGNAEFMKLMMDKSVSEAEKTRRLSASKIDGVTVTDTTQPITIEFQ